MSTAFFSSKSLLRGLCGLKTTNAKLVTMAIVYQSLLPQISIATVHAISYTCLELLVTLENGKQLGFVFYMHQNVGGGRIEPRVRVQMPRCGQVREAARLSLSFLDGCVETA